MSDHIRSIEIQCTRGVVDFVLSLECPACGLSFGVTSSNTLLFEEDIPCPQCKVPIRAGFESIQAFLGQHHTALLKGDAYRDQDERIASLERRIGAALPGDDSGIPDSCKRLYWDYLIMLNQTMLNAMLREEWDAE